MPIPTLDEYILLSRALQAAAAQDEAAVAGLRGARASLVWPTPVQTGFVHCLHVSSGNSLLALEVADLKRVMMTVDTAAGSVLL